MASKEKLDSLFDVTPKFLGELRSWLEPSVKAQVKNMGGGAQGAPGPPGPSLTIQDEGAPLTVRPKLNFIGAGVTAVDDAVNARTNVTIPGATGGGGTGIDFDQENDGGYLHTYTTDGTRISDEGSSGILLQALGGDGGIKLNNVGNGDIWLETAGGTTDDMSTVIRNDANGPLLIRQTGGPEYPDQAWPARWGGGHEGVGMQIHNTGDGSMDIRNNGQGPLVIYSSGSDVDDPAISTSIETPGGDIQLWADAGNIRLRDLPTVDPGVVGAIWNSHGDVVLSGYTPPVAGYIIPFSLYGPLAVVNGQLTWEALTAGSVALAHARVGVAPTGSSLVVRVNKNAALFATVTITAGTLSASAVPGAGAFAVGDLFTVDVTAIGSTNPGASLVVQLKVT